MKTKPELILDIGGVLVTNLTPFFWRELSMRSGVSHEALNEYRNEVRELLWSGVMMEEHFWTGLKSLLPRFEIAEAKQLLQTALVPLPALQEVPKWSQYADIHILSNHRMEWIEPIFNPVIRYLRKMTISSEVGSMKPNLSIFKLAMEHLNNREAVLYVDDSEKNLETAGTLGWQTLLADDHGVWISRVLEWMKANARD